MAGRPPLDIGTYGNIADPWQTASGSWQTKTRFRDSDGKSRPVTATGKTPAQAKANLKAKLLERKAHTNGTGELTRESPLADLVEKWLESLEEKRRSKVGSREGSLADDTVDGYIELARKFLIPGLGAVRLRELNTQRCDTYLAGLKTRKRQVRTVLMQVCGLGVRWSLLEYNPVRETVSPPRKQGSKRTLTPEDMDALRQRIQDWLDAPQPRGGRPRDSDMAELVDVLMATGERTGEVLALWWSDVHGLDDMSQPAKITISGTIDKKGKRQPTPKSINGYRIVKLPEWGREALIRQRERGYPFMLVFPSSAGTPRWVNNTNRTWREIRGEDYAWVTPKVFRKNAATEIERKYGAEAAAAQLGHSSPDITRKFYIDRAHEAPDNTAALDKFAPKVVNKRSTPPHLKVVGGE